MEKLLKIDQVADQLQVSKSLVYKWVHMDFIPYIKIGTCVRFREPDIVQWLKRKRKRGRNSMKVELQTL